MRKLISLLAVTLLILTATMAFAADDAKPAPTAPCPMMQSDQQAGGGHAMPGGMGMMGGKMDGKGGMMGKGMMHCPMMKQHGEMKAIVKETLVLQQRSLTATADEKKKIGAELTALIAKLDAMPAQMSCPMMDMQHGAAPDAPAPAKDAAKPAEHKH